MFGKGVVVGKAGLSMGKEKSKEQCSSLISPVSGTRSLKQDIAELKYTRCWPDRHFSGTQLHP